MKTFIIIYFVVLAIFVSSVVGLWFYKIKQAKQQVEKKG